MVEPRFLQDRIKLHGRGGEPDPVSRQGRSRPGAGGLSLLQSPFPRGPLRSLARLAEAVDLPLVIYNIPVRTGRNIELDTVERLARLESIVAIKEASGSLDQVSELLLPPN